MQPGLFLDRDGVIIENRDTYILRWEEVSFYNQALQTLATLNSSIYRIVMITNQSAIGRGLVSLHTAEKINRRIIEVIQEKGGRIDGVFMCPHTPADDCQCRKPRPGLILQAASELNIDLHRSILVGDALSDIQAGRSAGLSLTILVRTGRGAQQLLLPEARSLEPFPICDDLKEAVANLNSWQPNL